MPSEAVDNQRRNLTMSAMLLREPVDDAAAEKPLIATEIALPSIEHDQVLIAVSVCGVCRTDLDVVEGRITAGHYPIIPGHQVVGRVTEAGSSVTDIQPGDRVGVAWINSACGHCRWCLSKHENLCPEFRSTGCDADGGYAEYMAAPAKFVYGIPDALTDVDAAPLLCAGAIGWRSLNLTGLCNGEPLGLTGFGASAHLVLQLAQHRCPESPIYVFARSTEEQAFARELGATWAGDSGARPPGQMKAVIDTTPAWRPIVDVLRHIEPGGRLVINAIRKSTTDQPELLRLDYASDLWMEREIRSVANVTRADVREMLAAAAAMRMHPTVELLPLAEANAALSRLRTGRNLHGAMVLEVGLAA